MRTGTAMGRRLESAGFKATLQNNGRDKGERNCAIIIIIIIIRLCSRRKGEKGVWGHSPSVVAARVWCLQGKLH